MQAQTQNFSKTKRSARWLDAATSKERLTIVKRGIPRTSSVLSVYILGIVCTFSCVSSAPALAFSTPVNGEAVRCSRNLRATKRDFLSMVSRALRGDCCTCPESAQRCVYDIVDHLRKQENARSMHTKCRASSMNSVEPAPRSLRYFDSIEELQKWESTPDSQRAAPLGRDFPELPQRRRVMHCHDYQGGFRQSADEDYIATFSSWELFDLFVYFSHHRVVVPPHIWVERSHQENKIILGTFLFEGKRDSPQGALRGDLVRFLRYLRRMIKERVGPHAQVIYYDSHDKDGTFAHQNALLPHNKAVFEACDGIFLNYGWFEYGTLERSRTEAGTRQFDVYAGVDVWARNCEYDEGIGCKKAVTSATQEGVSVAIFAPGWVQEKGPGLNVLPGTEQARTVDCAFWQEILAPMTGET